MNRSANGNGYSTFEGVLNNFSAAPRQVAAACLIRCLVSVDNEDGKYAYSGLFQSTFDAMSDAIKRIGLRPYKISVRVLP